MIIYNDDAAIFYLNLKSADYIKFKKYLNVIIFHLIFLYLYEGT
jgi:hypothetical protein